MKGNGKRWAIVGAAILGLAIGAILTNESTSTPESRECADLAETSAALLDAGELEAAAKIDELWLRNCWEG